MKKIIISLALVLTALSSYAITPLWMRDARISQRKGNRLLL